MTRIEQETSICYNAAESNAIICTFSPKDQRRLERMGFKPCRRTGNGHWYYLPKQFICIRRPKRVILSESQKAAVSQRFRKAVSSQNPPVVQGKLHRTIDASVLVAETP